MNKKIVTLSILMNCLITSGTWAQCSIDKGPPPELVQYANDVRAELAVIRSQAGARNQCNGAAGSFSAERRFLSTLDRIDLNGSATDTAVNLPEDIALDFLYNVTFAFEGQSRGPVTNQGKIFKDLENGSIIPALETVTTLCALDVAIPSGGTPESRISQILKNNRAIERFFWKAATGDPTIPDGLEKYGGLLKSIQTNYSLEATSSCKDDYDIEDITSKIMTKLGNLTKGTKDAQNSWDEAIALFQGKNKGSAAYVKLQSRLLQAEMARQGLSENAKKAILRNLTCPEQKTDPTSSPEERAKANYECERSYVTGFDTVTKPFSNLVLQSKTTDEYIARTLAYSREKNRLSVDMMSFWSNIIKLKSNDEALNEKLINDLVSIHSELIITNTLLCKKAQEMYTNCMKAIPSIKCPTVSCE